MQPAASVWKTVCCLTSQNKDFICQANDSYEERRHKS